MSPFLSPFFNRFCPPRQISCRVGIEPRLNAINEPLYQREESEAGTLVITISVGSMALTKVDVAPKVFSHLIAFADYDPPAEASKVVFGAAWSTLIGLLVG